MSEPVVVYDRDARREALDAALLKFGDVYNPVDPPEKPTIEKDFDEFYEIWDPIRIELVTFSRDVEKVMNTDMEKGSEMNNKMLKDIVTRYMKTRKPMQELIKEHPVLAEYLEKKMEESRCIQDEAGLPGGHDPVKPDTAEEVEKAPAAPAAAAGPAVWAVEGDSEDDQSEDEDENEDDE